MKVLVAEDTSSIRMIITATVQQAGHQVVEAADGQEAVDLFKQQDIDLVIMDAEMPNIDGFRATEMLRAWAAEDWVPVIFLSAHNEDEYIQKALDCGADVYLRKPINAVELNGQIKALGRISDMKAKLDEVNRVLEGLARLDGLTKIANRRTFDERIDLEIARCYRNNAPLSILLCDIDHFKMYNDSYGHLAGDSCLRKVAKSISASFSRATDLVARYGGEEFVILLPDTGGVDSYRMAGEMVKSIANLKIPHRASATTDHVTISVGVTSTDGHEKISKGELIARADKALYNAKETGRDKAVDAKDL